MNRCLRALLALSALLSTHALSATEVAVCTDRGRAVLELEDDAAPLHVANFLRYVDIGYRTFILEVPASEEEIGHTGVVFDRAVSRCTA